MHRTAIGRLTHEHDTRVPCGSAGGCCAGRTDFTAPGANRVHCLLTVVLIALTAMPGAAATPDSDSDGISDSLEVQFGSEVDRAEQFQLLYHDGAIGRDDESFSEQRQDAPDFTDIWLANVARDRWLFRVDFAQPYNGGDKTFILYLDVDRDPTTGRQDSDANRGTDLMYVQKDGNFKVSAHTPGLRGGPLRMAAVADRIYVCADLPLGEGNARGEVRFKVLSHVSPPHARDQDRMPWQVVAAPPKRDADKPRIGPIPQLAPVANLSTEKPDTDTDGIPDIAEKVIGADPGHPGILHHIHHDKSAAEGDDLPQAFDRANDVTDLYFGNIAGNRWVWRLDFAEPFRGPGTTLILYLDADNDRGTGRTGWAAGTDVMLVYSGETFHPSIRNNNVTTLDRRLRGFIDGKSVYFSMDLLLNHNEEGHTEYRAHVLSQYNPGSGDNDNTDWFSVCGPGKTDRPKPRVAPLTEIRSEGIRVYDPWLTWREHLTRTDAVTIDLTEADLEKMHGEDRSLVADEPGATATVKSPIAGRYFLNIVLQDSAARDEVLRVSVADRRVAEIVAAQNDGDIHIHCTDEAVTVQEGTSITVTVDGPAQDARISEITLTPDALQPPPLRISHLQTWYPPHQEGDSVHVDVCFLTNRACRGRVEWGHDGLDSTAVEDQATYNHRIRLPDLQKGAQYRLRVIAGSGDETASEQARFTAAPRRPERCSVDRRRIQLSVLDAADDRPTWPVSGGVPIARGHLADASHCRLLKNDRPVPADFRELAWWPDGSIKWLLVTVLHTGGEYVLEYGEQVTRPQPPPDGIRVQQTEDGLRVTTDILRADISRRRFAPPGDLWRDLNGDGEFTDDEAVCTSRQGAVLVDAKGNQYSTTGRPAHRLTVEQSGAVRTVLLAEGRFAGDSGELMRYRCRMYFYRGFPAVPVVFTLINDEGDSVFPPTMTHITSLRIPVEFAHDFSEADWETGDPEVDLQVEKARQVIQQGMRLLHDHDNSYLLSRGDEAERHHGRKTCSAGLQWNGRGIAASLRDFWQLYPKAYSSKGSMICVELFPELPQDQYHDEDITPLERTRRYYWCRDGNYMIPLGVALSYDLLFYALGDDPAMKGRLADAWADIPLLAPEPDQYCRSGALGDLKPESDGVFEEYQQWRNQGFEGLEKRREQLRCYDWMNYGDTWGERMVNWTNQEYDLQWGLLVQFARNGDLRYFDRAEQAARHTAAVDTVNVSPRPRLLGIQKAHCLGHTGGHDIPRVANATYWFDRGIYNTGHMWTQGTFTTYCLTGDRRYFESARLQADWMADQYTRTPERWIHRNYGWATIAVLGAYDAVPNPWYLNAARFFCQNVVSRQDPGTGALIHPIGECEHEPKHRGGKTFMSGVVMTGLKMLDRIDPDPQYKNAIVRNCDWMHWRMWHPSDNSFQYAQCPQFDDSSTHAGTNMSCEGLAYAYDLTGNEAYREMLVRSLADNVVNTHCSTNGKGYAMDIRMTPFALSAMRDWPMKKLPLPPPPPPDVAPPQTIYLPPDRPGRLSLRVTNSGRQPLQAELHVLKLPDGVNAHPSEMRWSVQSGTHSGPQLALTGTAEGAVKARYRVGDVEGAFTAELRPAQQMQIGTEAGLVTGGDDTVAAALDALEFDLPRPSDLKPDTLANYASLLLGREAHEKDFCGLKDNWPNLLDFIFSGGKVAIIQLQNTSYQSGYLPLELTLSNDSGRLADVAKPDHPLFTEPNPVGSLAGIISYDTIVAADEAWAILARDENHNPSIVSCEFGAGSVLVVQPSPDRYVIGEETPPEGLTKKACAQLLHNIVAWLRRN